MSLKASATEVIGDLLWACERGVFVDFVQCYGRLLSLFGRRISDVPPAQLVQRWGLSATRILHRDQEVGQRLAGVQMWLGPVLRNINALDAERHWLLSDAYILGLCMAESLAMGFAGDRCRQEAIEADDHEKPREAEALRNAAAAYDALAERYGKLADRQGWPL